jgi:IS5 family transposase
MVDHISTEKGFMDHFVERRVDEEGFLSQVDRLMDWSPIEKLLKKHYKKVAAADGRPAYPALTMFKILLMQRWYDLSDAGMSEALRDRLSFIKFSGLSFHSPTPDASTICRFRQALAYKDLYRRLLEGINRQLEKHGLIVKTGVAVDASLVASSRRPRKVIEVEAGEQGKPSIAEDSGVKVSYSDDAEASWTVKGKQAHYGYKVHMGTDFGEGFMLGGHVTPAHVSDSTELEPLVDELDLPEGTLVLADKGYVGQRNDAVLEARRLKNGIMEKAWRNHPLPREARTRNLLIGKLRYVVEQGFGTLKRSYRFGRARYLGRLKTEIEFHLLAMAFNLKKAVRLMAA